jgi:dephospho-CoA kinase
VRVIAVTGGIGSGKTAVTDFLSTHGAFVVDADIVAREIVQPGEPAWRALVDGFGQGILGSQGEIDRPFLARVAFSSPTATLRLNQITHGAIGHAMVEKVAQVPSGAPVVLALPLFRPEHRVMFGIDEVWGIEVPTDIAIERLIERRGFTREDAEQRVRAQISNEQRRNIVDILVPNTGTLSELHAVVSEHWRNFLGAV